jgi:hypothetical protein
MTEHEVIRVAKAAMIARFPNSVAGHEPYRAEFSNGNWDVFGTAPEGMFGGGSPVAIIRDSDGMVTKIYLSK